MRTALVSLSVRSALGVVLTLLTACAGPRESGIDAPEGRAAVEGVQATDEQPTGRFEKVILTEQVTYPMELDVAPDGRVFFIERDGSLKIWDPDTGATSRSGRFWLTTRTCTR